MIFGCLAALGIFVDASLVAADDLPATGQWVRKEGRHIRLVTDLPDSPALQQWVAVFDAAVPLWAAYWQRNPDELNSWRVTAYLMVDRDRFITAGLLPQSLPDFRFGYQVGNRLWVIHQVEDYYNRHLLLHEGAHAVTSHLLGGSGPPWFMEGTAEWMSTHTWRTTTRPHSPDSEYPDRLEIGVVPPSSPSVQGWGRIELIATARKEKRVPTIESVMKYGDVAHREVEPYAWSWLALVLMDMYPEYRQSRLESASIAADRSPQFNSNLYAKLRSKWPIFSARWNLLAHDIDYGWDAARQQVDLPTDLEKIAGKIDMKLKTDRGWQSAPVRVGAGQTVKIDASGRYKIRRSFYKDSPGVGFDALTVDDAGDPDDTTSVTGDWYSEPDGITIHYYRGKPIGRLVACLLPISMPPGGPYASPLEEISIGRSATITPSFDSWLLLKVNEPPAEYRDNDGAVDVVIEPAG